MENYEGFDFSRALRMVVMPFLGILLFLILWQITSSYFVPEQSTLPTPIRVAQTLGQMWHSGELADDVVASLKRILAGFTIALCIAIAFGVVAARYGKIYRSIKSLMDLLSSIPPIAWTPLAILWFGIGDLPAYFIVFLGAFFPMFTGIYAGITLVDNNLIDAAKTLGASSSLVVRRVVLPASFPQIVTGIRTGLGVAWFNVIAAELVGVRSGLGYKIQLSRTLLFSEQVIAIMLVIGVLGFCMTRAAGIVGNMVSPWAIQDESRTKWIGRRMLFRKLLRLRSTLVKDNAISPPIRIQEIPHAFERVPNADSPFVLLEVDRISKSFCGQKPEDTLLALDGVSFKIYAREVFCILGPNGSGKTTIIKIVAGLLPPDSGNVKFENRYVTFPSFERTVIFQDYALFPWKTSRGNVEFALEAQSCDVMSRACSKNDRQVKSSALLQDAGLQDFVDSYPMDLSGGMKQRLALARALAVSPKLILMDEPFASLDPIVREQSQESILQLISSKEKTILLVTHNLDEAVFMSDRILVLSKRPGRVKTIIDIDLPRPRTAAIRCQPKFNEYRNKLFQLLRSE